MQVVKYSDEQFFPKPFFQVNDDAIQMPYTIMAVCKKRQCCYTNCHQQMGVKFHAFERNLYHILATRWQEHHSTADC